MRDFLDFPKICSFNFSAGNARIWFFEYDVVVETYAFGVASIRIKLGAVNMRFSILYHSLSIFVRFSVQTHVFEDVAISFGRQHEYHTDVSFQGQTVAFILLCGHCVLIYQFRWSRQTTR